MKVEIENMHELEVFLKRYGNDITMYPITIELKQEVK